MRFRQTSTMNTRKQSKLNSRAETLLVSLVGVAGLALMCYIWPPANASDVSYYVGIGSYSLCIAFWALLSPSYYAGLSAGVATAMTLLMAVGFGICWGVAGLYTKSPYAFIILAFAPAVFAVCGNLLVEFVCYLVIWGSACVAAYLCNGVCSSYHFSLSEHYSSSNCVIWLKEIGAFLMGFGFWNCVRLTRRR